ncbi:MAG: hypothetical protein ABI648_02850 [Betaproteobacteria bacterium]
MENPALTCNTCGKPLAIPASAVSAALIEEESVRCDQLREIAQQRQTLAAKMQSGIVGLLGGDTADTVDMIAQRKSLAQLDAALQGQAEDLASAMSHAPDWR